MTIRGTNSINATRRAHLTTVRATVDSIDDTQQLQVVTFRGMQNEMMTAERMQPYGMTSNPQPPGQASVGSAPSSSSSSSSSGTEQPAAELHVTFVNGNRSHPIANNTDDGRYRPTGGEAGQVTLYDFRGVTQKFQDAGWTHDGGSLKKPAMFKVGNATITFADGKITLDVNGKNIVVEDSDITATVGSTSLKVEASDVTATVGGNVFKVTGDQILCGPGASIPVMTQAGPSTRLFVDK